MNVVIGWALTLLQILFGLGAISSFAGFTGDRSPRTLLLAATYSVAATGSLYLNAWWLLFVGFAFLMLFADDED